MWPSGCSAKDYVTLVAATISLGGVVFSLLFNAARARRVDKEQRDRDAASMRTAMGAELQQLHQDMVGHRAFLLNGKDEAMWIPIIDYFAAFKANASRLGALSTQEVAAIVKARTTYDREMANVVQVCGRDVVAFGQGQSASCDLTFAGNRKHLGKVYGRIEDAAAEALAVLRPASPARVIQLNTR